MSNNNIKLMSIIWTIGVFLVSLTYLLLHKNLIFYDLIFWSGILLSGLSTYAIISNSDNKTGTKLIFLFLFGFVLYIPRVLFSPDHFHIYDDLIHYQSTMLTYETGNIDTQSTFTISKYYPTLEIVTVIFKNMTGGSILSSGLIIVGIAHSFTAIFLYLFFRNICSKNSEKIASIGTFAYFFSSSYVQFDTYFSYESIGLPLLAACLFTISLSTVNEHMNNISKITFIQLILIIGVTITHHFSSYMLLSFMIVLLINKTVIKESENYKRISTITLLIFSIIFAWTIYVAKTVLTYYNGIIGNAIKGVLSLSMFNERVSEILTNQLLDVPYYELIIRRFIYIPLIMALVFMGIYYLYSKKKIYNGYILTLTIFCGLFFLSLVGMVTSSFGIERFFTFGFIGIAFLLGISIDRIERIKMLQKIRLSRVLAIISVSLLLIGGVSIGTTSPFRGSYSNNSRIGQETITTDLIYSAEWSEKYLGRGNTFISDIVTGAAFGNYGFQKVSPYSAWEVFFPSDVDKGVLDHLKIYVIDYLAVDKRVTRLVSELGYYFENEELYIKNHPMYGRKPMPIDSIQKFDNSSTFYKMYDNGNINIYKVSML